MSIFTQWPWTNFNEYNLDWIIKKVKYIEEHLEEIVVDATSDILDDTLTNPDKAAQAKVTGDAIRGNAADIASLDTTVQGAVNNISNLTIRVTRNENTINNLLAADEDLDDRITDLNNRYLGTRTDVSNLTSDIASLNTTVQGAVNNISNLTTRVTRNENTINNLLAADENFDDRLTELNNRYLGTVTDVTNLTSRVSHAESEITDLEGADAALGNRITALEGTVNAVKDYVFNIYLYTGANDPMWICTMEDSPNTINSLLTDLNGRIPVNVKAVISNNGITSSRVGNLTTVRVGNEIHGVEFDAGEFHCRFLDSNTMGAAYYRHVVITSTSDGSGVYTKGDYWSIANYKSDVNIVIGSTSYKVIKVSPGQDSDDLMLAYLTLNNQNELIMQEVSISANGNIQFS